MIFFSMLKDFINVTHVRGFFKTKQAISPHALWAHTKSPHTKKSGSTSTVSNFLLEKDVHKTLEKVIASVLMTDDARNSAVDTTSTSTPTTSTTVKVKTNRKRYDFCFKMDVIEQVKSGITPVTLLSRATSISLWSHDGCRVKQRLLMVQQVST